jgi:hypothetical protein
MKRLLPRPPRNSNGRPLLASSVDVWPKNCSTRRVSQYAARDDPRLGANYRRVMEILQSCTIVGQILRVHCQFEVGPSCHDLLAATPPISYNRSGAD